jgi:DNA-directed RNA polymerase specialized sigma24 family protein
MDGRFLHTQVEVVVVASGRANVDAATAGPLAALTDRQREVLRLRVVVGLSVEATASVLGTTPELVRVTQHRALNRLRRALGID